MNVPPHIGKCSLVGNTMGGTYYSYWLLSVCCTKLNLVEVLQDYFIQFGKVDTYTIMCDAAGCSRCFDSMTQQVSMQMV